MKCNITPNLYQSVPNSQYDNCQLTTERRMTEWPGPAKTAAVAAAGVGLNQSLVDRSLSRCLVAAACLVPQTHTCHQWQLVVTDWLIKLMFCVNRSFWRGSSVFTANLLVKINSIKATIHREHKDAITQNKHKNLKLTWHPAWQRTRTYSYSNQGPQSHVTNTYTQPFYSSLDSQCYIHGKLLFLLLLLLQVV